jgi:integrase
MAVRYLNDRGKWLASVGKGKDRVSKTFNTEPEAQAWEATAGAAIKANILISRQRDEAIRERTPADSLGGLLDVCAGLDWAGKDPSQHRVGGRLVKILGPCLHPGEITTAVIDQFVTDSKAEGRSNGTIKHYLSALGVMLKRAQRLGMIDSLPLFPEQRMLKSAEPRNLVLPLEWYTELVDYMEKREQRTSVGLSWFLWHMGCRVGEALNLTWDRIDTEHNRINFVKTKGGLPRSLPIPVHVVPILSAMKARDSESVFPLAYQTFQGHYRDAKNAACDKLGLTDAVRGDWCIHTVRHTCLTGLAQRGWGAPAISQWAGHGSLAITQRYVHGSAINLEALMEC